MHKFYVHRLRPTLAAAIEQVVKDSPLTEQLSLIDELALLRHSAGASVELYSVAVETGKLEAVITAGELMKADLERVAKMVDAAAKVEEVKARVAGSFVTAMGQIMQIVLDCAQKTFGDHHLIKEFELALRDRVEFAQEQQRAVGVDFSPADLEDQVIAMDDTVPAVTLSASATVHGESNGESGHEENGEADNS